MRRGELARLLDHSALNPESTEADILAGADLVRRWAIGFYCVQPSFVSVAVATLEGSGAPVVSVVGFPHGCERSVVKAQAAVLAVQDSASEDFGVKAAGGIRTLQDVLAMLEAGANRIGMSASDTILAAPHV